MSTDGGGAAPQHEGVALPDGPDHPVVALARRAVETYVRTGETLVGELPQDFSSYHGGVFVSLHMPDGALRGCLGTVAATRGSLAEEVVANAVAASSRDPRFLPVAPSELEGLHISVDVLGEPEEVEGADDLDPQTYGIIVKTDDGRQALLLPDLEGVTSAQQQLRLTCRKGGIDPEKDRYRLYRFRVERYGR